MEIQQLVPAEAGWKALFEEPTEEITRSRILGWALVQTGKTVEVVGMIVDPPSRPASSPRPARAPRAAARSRGTASSDA